MAGKLNLGKVRGTTIYTGTEITGVDANGKTFPKSGITKAYEEDMYVNTDVNSESQGNVYICLTGGDADTAAWAYNGNLRGPQCEVINNLESSRTDAALTAYQGRILKDMMYDSGLITKEVEIDYSGNVQGIKVTTENRATTITVQTASGNITQEKAAGAETTTVSAVPAKQILKVSSSDAYIRKIELYDASNNLVYTDNISSWGAIEDIRKQMEESGSVLDNGTTLPTGILTKIAGGVKKVLYPISHAKAIWYDKKNNKTVYDAISSLTENTEKMDAALAIAGKPDEYSTSKTYAVGDKCIYENALYKCTTAISAAEAWTAGHWTKTSLCAEDAANKAAIKELTEKADSLHFPLTLLSKTDGISIYYARYGKIVEIVAIGNFSKAETIESGKGLTIGVLPAGFRPADIRFFGLGFLYSNSSCLTLAIDKTGTITVTSTSAAINISSGRYFNFCKHFMIP